MRNLFRTLASAALLLVSARTAQAGTVTVHFNNGGTTTAFGYYVGQYNGTVNGKAVTLNCVDFFHHVTNNQTWTANVTNGLGGMANLSNTRWGSVPNALDLYRKAAFLTQQYAGKSSTEIANIQATVWNMFGKAGAPTPTDNYWMQYANAHYMDKGLGYYNNFQILSDATPGAEGAQEMIIYVTPEPASMLLFGTGLAAFGAARRRRKQRDEETADA